MSLRFDQRKTAQNEQELVQRSSNDTPRLLRYCSQYNLSENKKYQADFCNKRVRLWIKKNLICLHVLLKVFDSWTHTKHLHGWVKSKSTKEGISLFSLCLVAMNSQELPLHGWIFKCGQIFFQSSCNSALMRMSQITNANDSYQSTVSVFQHEREFASLRLWRSLLFISSLLKRFFYVSVIMPHRDLSGG